MATMNGRYRLTSSASDIQHVRAIQHVRSIQHVRAIQHVRGGHPARTYSLPGHGDGFFLPLVPYSLRPLKSTMAVGNRRNGLGLYAKDYDGSGDESPKIGRAAREHV